MKNITFKQGKYEGQMIGWYWLEFFIDGQLENYFEFENKTDVKNMIAKIKSQYKSI